MCGVEQTSLGMFLFEEKPPPFAVISWARAAVKLEIGGPIFSQCLIDRLNTEFRERSTFNANNSASSEWEASAGPSRTWLRAGQRVFYLRSAIQICRLSNAEARTYPGQIHSKS